MRSELLGQLLRNGTSTAGFLLPHQATLHHGSGHRAEVYARVLVEALVFRSHQGLQQAGSNVIIVYEDAVFAQRPSSHQYSVGTHHLRGKLADGIFELLNGWHVAYPSLDNGREEHHRSDHSQQQEEP